MKNLENFYFEVEQVKSTTFFGIDNANTDFTSCIVGFIEGEKTLLNVSSDTYALLKNEDVFPIVESALIDNGLQISKHYQNIDNSRFYGKYIINNFYTYLDKNKTIKIKPVVIVRNSYNRLTRFSVSFGLYNESSEAIHYLNLPKNVLGIDKKHSTDVKFIVEKTINFLKEFISNIRYYANDLIDLHNAKVNEEDYLYNLLEALKIPIYRSLEVSRFLLEENKLSYLEAITRHYKEDYIKALEAREKLYKDTLKAL